MKVQGSMNICVLYNMLHKFFFFPHTSQDIISSPSTCLDAANQTASFYTILLLSNNSIILP